MFHTLHIILYTLYNVLYTLYYTNNRQPKATQQYADKMSLFGGEVVGDAYEDSFKVRWAAARVETSADLLRIFADGAAKPKRATRSAVNECLKALKAAADACRVQVDPQLGLSPQLRDRIKQAINMR